MRKKRKKSFVGQKKEFKKKGRGKRSLLRSTHAQQRAKISKRFFGSSLFVLSRYYYYPLQ